MKGRMIRCLLLLTVFLALAPALAAQDIEPIPPWEPPPIPPEPPAQDCGFSYIGYIQTSQGVLQDDPQDTDFLRVIKGTSTLSRNLASAQEAFYQPQALYQVPTFEAGIDMVVGRETYLLAANPGTAGGGLFHLEGKSAFTAEIPVHLRVTVVLNGRVIKQFLVNDPGVPAYVRVGGGCAQPPLPPAFEVLYSEDMLGRAVLANAGAIRFDLDEPGRYLVRAELVRADPWLMTAQLKPIGVAVDVRGRVVTTRAPSVLVIPVAGSEEEHEIFADLVERHLVPHIRDGVQYAMAVPSGPAPTLFIAPEAFSGTILDQLDFQIHLSLIKRFSSPSRQPDRFVVVLEDDEYDRFRLRLPWNTTRDLGFLNPTFKSVAFVRGPELVYNPLGYIPPYPALQRQIIATVMHELYHSIGWNPKSTAEMGDCQVDPYHNLDAKIANGLDLQDPRKSPYFGRPDFMGSGAEPEDPPPLVSQCTYRYSLEELSKASIDPPVLMVSAVLRGSALSPEVELAPVYEMDGFDELPEDGEGSWKILLRDADGNLLASHPFQPDWTIEGELVAEVYFNYTVERPPNVDRIEITAPRFIVGSPPQDEVVASRHLSDHAPTLDASAFRFLGRWIVNWDGYDADGDSLLYTVLTSTDGGLYVPTEVVESSETGLTLDDPYGTIRHVMVIATDGGRSVVETLDL